MDNDKIVNTLNSLIEINNDRIEGYQTASSETEDMNLKQFFTSLAQTSHNCKRELSNEVTKLGGIPAEGTRMTGKFYRVWMDIKSTFTGKDTKAILNSCEFGEDAAVGAYKEALGNREGISESASLIIEKQYELIKADHNRVKVMRNSTG